MNIKKVLKRRKSCRKFIDKPIKLEILEKIIWAGQRAPYASGGPRRDYSIHMDNKRTKNQIQEACFDQEYVGTCGAIIVISGTDTKAMLFSGHAKYIFDCAAACMCMDLMATSLGLETCWIGHFDADEVKKVIATKYRPTIILLVGYGKSI